MKKYFYTNGVDKIGPFSFEEFKKQDLTNETKVWFYGLDNWITLSEVEELNSITSSIPPKLKIAKAKETQNTIEPKITKQKLSIKKKREKTNNNKKEKKEK